MSSAVIANCCALQFSIEVYIDQRAKFNCAGSHSVHHFTMPYQRIYSENLDGNRSWYAYNLSITDYQRRNRQHSHKGDILFKSFPSEIQQVNIGDFRNTHGRRVQSHVFGTTKFELVYAVSSIGNMFHTNSLSIPYPSIYRRALCS